MFTDDDDDNDNNNNMLSTNLAAAAANRKPPSSITNTSLGITNAYYSSPPDLAMSSDISTTDSSLYSLGASAILFTTEQQQQQQLQQRQRQHQQEEDMHRNASGSTFLPALPRSRSTSSSSTKRNHTQEQGNGRRDTTTTTTTIRRRNLLQRAASVPSGIMGISSNNSSDGGGDDNNNNNNNNSHKPAAAAAAVPRLLSNFVDFMEQAKSKSSHHDDDDDDDYDDDGEDSTIEESWRKDPNHHPLRSTATATTATATATSEAGEQNHGEESSSPTITINSSGAAAAAAAAAKSVVVVGRPSHMANFLDSLIVDANHSYQRKSPAGANFRKRLQHNDHVGVVKSSKTMTGGSSSSSRSSDKKNITKQEEEEQQQQQAPIHQHKSSLAGAGGVVTSRSIISQKAPPHHADPDADADAAAAAAAASSPPKSNLLDGDSMPSLHPCNTPSTQSRKSALVSRTMEELPMKKKTTTTTTTIISKSRKRTSKSPRRNNSHSNSSEASGKDSVESRKSRTTGKQPPTTSGKSSSRRRARGGPASLSEAFGVPPTTSTTTTTTKQFSAPTKMAAPPSSSLENMEQVGVFVGACYSPPGRSRSLVGTRNLQHQYETPEEGEAAAVFRQRKQQTQQQQQQQQRRRPPAPTLPLSPTSPSGDISIVSMNTAGDTNDTDGLLSAFLDREGSKHRRTTTSAHTVSGDPRVRGDLISIAITSSAGVGNSGTNDPQKPVQKTFQVGPREAAMIQKLLEQAAAGNCHNGDEEAETALNSSCPTVRADDTTMDQHSDLVYESPLTTTKPKFTAADHEEVYQTPSNHSTIAESDRISTRSSLIVELSPPLVDGDGIVGYRKKKNRITGHSNNLKQFLDRSRQPNQHQRGRRKGSAYTVAGDRVSVRFEGKSTSEMLNLLKEEQRERELTEIHEGTTAAAAKELGSASTKHALRPTKSGARHPRSDLESMANTPDLVVMNRVMHQSMQFLETGAGAFGESMASLFGGSQPPTTTRIALKNNMESPTREELQSYLDGRSPNSRRRLGGSRSVSRDRLQRSSREKKKRNSSSTTTNSSSEDLREFQTPVGSGRPTNRRSLMRKMQSVPILSVDPIDISTSSNVSLSKGNTQTSRTSSLVEIRSRRRSRSKEPTKNPNACKSPTRSSSLRRGRKQRTSTDSSVVSETGSTKSKTKRSSSQNSRKSSSRRGGKKVPNKHQQTKEPELELEDLHKSFLDQFLDGDFEGNDSASQIKDAKEVYKASLVAAATSCNSPAATDTDEANRPNPNRPDPLQLVTPEPTRHSQRTILRCDPLKSPDRVRTDYKRVKSNSGDELSSRLLQLYDPLPTGATKAKPKVGTITPQTKNAKKAVGFQSGTEAASPSKTASVLDSSKNTTEVESTPTSSSIRLIKRPGSKRPSASTSTPKGKSKDKSPSSNHESQKVSKETKNFDNDDNPEVPLSTQAPATVMYASEKVTLKSLPRQGRATGDTECNVPDTSGHVRLVERLLQLSNRSLDVDDSPAHALRSPTAQRFEPSKINKTPILARSPSNTTDDSPSETSGWTKAGVTRPPLTGDLSSSGKNTDAFHTSFNTPEASSPPPKQPTRKASRPPPDAGDEVRIIDNRPPLPAGPPRLQSPRPGRLPPVAIAEGSILEVTDDSSVCSELTDNFSWEPMENEYSKRARRQLGLLPIDESGTSEQDQRTLGDTSWGRLSHSGKDDAASMVSTLSRDKRMHLSKRWQSTPNLGAGHPADMLKSPTRGQEDSAEERITKTPGRFGWLKKKIGLKKN